MQSDPSSVLGSSPRNPMLTDNSLAGSLHVLVVGLIECSLLDQSCSLFSTLRTSPNSAPLIMSWLAVVLLSHIATLPLNHKFGSDANQVDQGPPLGFDTPWWPVAAPGPIKVPGWVKPAPPSTPEVTTTTSIPFPEPPTQPPVTPNSVSPTSWTDDRKKVALVAVTVVVVLAALAGCVYACRWELFLQWAHLMPNCMARPPRDSGPRYTMEELAHLDALRQARSDAFQDARRDEALAEATSSGHQFLEACGKAERRAANLRPDLMHHSTPSTARSFSPTARLPPPPGRWSSPPSYSNTAL